jgi:hypothetical protein
VTDKRHPSSQVWIVGEPASRILPISAGQPLLITFEGGAPRVHISNVRIAGQLRVDGADLLLMDCTIEDVSGRQASDTGQVGSSNGERALSVRGGQASLTRTLLTGHPEGAILADAAQLILVDCIIQSCRALTGGAVLMRGGAIMRAERSRFADNSASVSGAALQIDDGDVHLLNETILEGNTAPDDGGSIRLSSNSTLQYTLPAPPGHWLFIPQGDTFFLEQRVVTDSEFPYACPAGVVGGTTTREQSGPGCKERMLPLIPTIGVPIAVRQLVRRAVCAQPERRIQALVHVGRIARAARRWL